MESEVKNIFEEFLSTRRVVKPPLYELTINRDVKLNNKIILLKNTVYNVEVLKFDTIGEWNEDGGEKYFAALVMLEDGTVRSIYLDYEGSLKRIR